MAYSYVGAVGAGHVANIAGENLGEHVAYLTGGELTMAGATAGTVRYINALANTSTVSGGIDYALTGTNWVRIQPGATLRKAGSNQITFNGVVTNNGVLEVAQGTLRVGVSVAGGGSVRLKGGTLTLTSAGRLNTAPLIDVQAGGSLNVSALGSLFNVTSGQTLNVQKNGIVIGNLTAISGAALTGGGVLTNNLTAQTGSVVRVGKDGSGVASRFIIDNFESYTVGDVRTVASPPWTAHQDTSLADVEDFSGNKVLTYGWGSDFRGVSRSLPANAEIDNSEIATIFFRFSSKTDDPDHSFGLGDQANTAGVDFTDYETQLRLKQGAVAGTFALDARSGGAFTSTLASGLALNTWYNTWMVINQSTDMYDVYINTGTGAATTANKLNPSPLSFRNGTPSNLSTILGLAGSAPVDNGVRFDDLVYLAGVDLTNPIAGFDPGLSWTAETLTVNGNYTQHAGATLQLNVFDSANSDRLAVGGSAALAGTLSVSFGFGAPRPEAGDVFDLLDFGSCTGVFDAVMLPALDPGLVWDNSLLLSSGELRVAAGVPGDFNNDVLVDSADYIVWRNSLGQTGAGLPADGNADLHVNQADFAVWRANFGAAFGSGNSLDSRVADALPEPSAALFAVIILIIAVSAQLKRDRSCG